LGTYRTKVRVLYADTDMMGIVYHANYLRWFEAARTELLRSMGIIYADLEMKGYYLPVTESYCHYHSPALYDQVLTVEAFIARARRASMRIHYRITKEQSDVVITEGFTVHAFTDRQGTIVRIPDDILKIILQNTKEECCGD
jgi:acyl-CoA thioester hydrolase